MLSDAAGRSRGADLESPSDVPTCPGAFASSVCLHCVWTLDCGMQARRSPTTERAAMYVVQRPSLPVGWPQIVVPWPRHPPNSFC
eukprot:1217746-Alexandrium_andersonii.AAC.4